MKVILYMAMAANGIIATESGGEDFLSHENWKKLSELVEEFGNFVIGRKTYEAVKNWNEEYSFDDFVDAEKIVISQDKNFKLDEGYTLANSPEDALAELSQKGFEKVLVSGGANVNSAFAKENLLDEIILNVEPAIIGKGIPVFVPNDFELKLHLVSAEKSASGIVTLRYNVLK